MYRWLSVYRCKRSQQSVVCVHLVWSGYMSYSHWSVGFQRGKQTILDLRMEWSDCSFTSLTLSPHGQKWYSGGLLSLHAVVVKCFFAFYSI